MTPSCCICGRQLLDGAQPAWKRKGEPGDWSNLQLICQKCFATGGRMRELYVSLRCECPCSCGGRAVGLVLGNLACAECTSWHVNDKQA